MNGAGSPQRHGGTEGIRSPWLRASVVEYHRASVVSPDEDAPPIVDRLLLAVSLVAGVILLVSMWVEWMRE